MKNHQKKYRGLTHNVVANRYYADRRIRQKAFPEKKQRLRQLKDFLIEKVFKWLWHTLAHLLASKHAFVTHTPPNNGCYVLDDTEEAVIAVAGDWATNTAEAREVANAMQSHKPHYTIHLGDTYYVGDENEITANFIADGAPWQKGSKGSFALLGNHEMYSMGRAYYDNLLKTLGQIDPKSKKPMGQTASYFCLQNSSWIIIALDTGYNSVGFPFVWNSFRTDSRLPQPLVDWLKNTLRLNEDKRGIVFLSHHQYCSGFKNSHRYTNVGKQLAEIIGKDRKVIWMWGHEHRFAVYGRYTPSGGIPAYGRCIGHGGMPIELDKIKVDPYHATVSGLVGYDDRKKETIDNDNPVGWNGYAVLKLLNESLTLSYHDVKNNLLEETWTVDGKGEIRGKVRSVSTKLKLHASRWDLMVL